MAPLQKPYREVDLPEELPAEEPHEPMPVEVPDPEEPLVPV